MANPSLWFLCNSHPLEWDLGMYNTGEIQTQPCGIQGWVCSSGTVCFMAVRKGDMAICLAGPQQVEPAKGNLVPVSQHGVGVGAQRGQVE